MARTDRGGDGQRQYFWWLCGDGADARDVQEEGTVMGTLKRNKPLSFRGGVGVGLVIAAHRLPTAPTPEPSHEGEGGE